jgi:hypothetical protein
LNEKELYEQINVEVFEVITTCPIPMCIPFRYCFFKQIKNCPKKQTKIFISDKLLVIWLKKIILLNIISAGE